MSQFIAFFSDKPFLCLTLAIGSFFMAVYLHRQAKAMRFAQWVADKGQYQQLDLCLLDEAIQDAKYKNKDEEFMRFLRVIRTTVGHENLRIGHLYWIWDQMEKNILADALNAVPNFDEANPTDIQVIGK